MTVSVYSDIVSLLDFDTPDPFLVLGIHGTVYLTFTAGDRIDLVFAASLLQLKQGNFSRKTLWRPSPGSSCSVDLWAPELHAIDDRWHIYFTAADPHIGPTSRRLHVLVGPSAKNRPDVAASWTLLGPVRGLPPHQWAIDATVATFGGVRCLIYSGWPLGDLNGDLTQQLFIARLTRPDRVDSPAICIAAPLHSWEFSRDARGAHGINEGPQFLQSPDGSWKGLLFSCAGSWTSEYKMSVLKFLGGDPLDVRNWQKSAKPLLQADAARPTGLYGPGHGCAVSVAKETLCIFHATEDPHDGWSRRRARAQRIVWTDEGPSMGDNLGHVSSPFDVLDRFKPSPRVPKTSRDGRYGISLLDRAPSWNLDMKYAAP